MQVDPLACWDVQTDPLQKLPEVQSVSSTQEVEQVVLDPSQRYGEQDGLPAEPSGTTEQVPSLPASSQASQLSPQAVLQQYPSTQFPL